METCPYVHPLGQLYTDHGKQYTVLSLIFSHSSSFFLSVSLSLFTPFSLPHNVPLQLVANKLDSLLCECLPITYKLHFTYFLCVCLTAATPKSVGLGYLEKCQFCILYSRFNFVKIMCFRSIVILCLGSFTANFWHQTLTLFSFLRDDVTEITRQ